MARKSIVKAEIDLDALESELKAAKPERIEYKEVLEKMRATLQKQVAAGVSYDRLAQILANRGIKVTANRIKRFLSTNDTRSPAELAQTGTAAGASTPPAPPPDPTDPGDFATRQPFE